jgi:hypothetical protein
MQKTCLKICTALVICSAAPLQACIVMQVRMRGTGFGGEKSVVKCGAVGGLSWEKFLILGSIG